MTDAHRAAEKIREVCCIVWDKLPDDHPLKNVDDKLTAIITDSFAEREKAVDVDRVWDNLGRLGCGGMVKMIGGQPAMIIEKHELATALEKVKEVTP